MSRSRVGRVRQAAIGGTAWSGQVPTSFNGVSTENRGPDDADLSSNGWPQIGVVLLLKWA